MNVKEVIKKSLLTYPSLNEDRWDVLFHVLCSYGTGYEWNENGEIEQTFSSDYAENINDAVKRQFEFILSDKSLLHSGLSFSREYLKKALLTLLDWEDNMEKFVPKEKSVEIERYLSLDYSPIYNIPDNISEDWKKAVLEMIEYLLTVLTNKTHIMRIQEVKEKIS